MISVVLVVHSSEIVVAAELFVGKTAGTFAVEFAKNLVYSSAPDSCCC